MKESDSNVFGCPVIHADSFVSEAAEVFGMVEIDNDVVVLPHASIRADEGSPFKICKGTNIQDGVVIHGLLNKFVEVGDKQYSVYIDSHCSIAHGALIHGPTKIGKKTFVGFGAVIHNSVIGRNCVIHHGAIVEGVTLPANTYVPHGCILTKQADVAKLPVMPENIKEFNKEVVDYNKLLCHHYKSQKFKFNF